MITPISKFMLGFLASRGLELPEARIGLQDVPQEHVDAFAEQNTLFLEGYATCLSDMLELLNGPFEEEGNRYAKAFSAVMHTWLYLCSHIIAKRDKPNPSA